MSKSKILKVLNFILIVFLVGGCIHFYNLYRDTDTKLNNTTTGVGINIGKYDGMGGMYFNIVTSPDDRNQIIIALINAETVDKPEITSKKTNAHISIYNEGMVFYNIDLWHDGDKVVFDFGDGYEKRYKEISINSQYFLEVISKYIPKN